ncbi:hypothetical protein CPB83DRAFT_462801 [Crepidotus variabilis]|uniref:Uncharacterized protein n=1 Tax=Crepidotus variabilis TaxID=179855 RepID=A0A9P6JN99_9AGAR|nr:hypothetical protein CPB83DRAFT_462801 [Crepidotus variabilis]
MLQDIPQRGSGLGVARTITTSSPVTIRQSFLRICFYSNEPHRVTLTIFLALYHLFPFTHSSPPLLLIIPKIPVIPSLCLISRQLYHSPRHHQSSIISGYTHTVNCILVLRPYNHFIAAEPRISTFRHPFSTNNLPTTLSRSSPEIFLNFCAFAKSSNGELY